MLTRKPKPKTSLEEAIERATLSLKTKDPDSKEYSSIVKQLQKLTAMKTDTCPSRRISPDVAATIAANLLGIVIIVGYEQRSVLSSKALGFVQKLR